MHDAIHLLYNNNVITKDEYNKLINSRICADMNRTNELASYNKWIERINANKLLLGPVEIKDEKISIHKAMQKLYEHGLISIEELYNIKVSPWYNVNSLDLKQQTYDVWLTHLNISMILDRLIQHKTIKEEQEEIKEVKNTFRNMILD